MAGDSPQSRLESIHGHTPWLNTDEDEVKTTTTQNRLRIWILNQTNGSPLLRDHLIAIFDTGSWLLKTKSFWIFLVVIVLFIVQSIFIQWSAENSTHVQLLQSRKQVDYDWESEVTDAFREWKIIQERYPGRFDNFSQFLIHSKRKESNLRKRLADLSDQSIQLLNNIVVPPVSGQPKYNTEEDYELTWNYLMPEKSWPYTGSERYLDELPKRSRKYYNSLAVFPHNNKTRLHGLAGIYPNGTRAWTPAPMPPPINDSPIGKAKELENGGFYLNLSNALPLDRDVEDLRPAVCTAVNYNMTNLEDASVVITFYNEHASTLLRSIHSVLNQTPPPLLREIILVDDHSNTSDLLPGGFLDQYVKLLPKTKILRLPERRGLVQARLAGAQIAKAPIFVVLDSHIEVNPGWLEPQLQRLGESPKSVVFPQIMSLDTESFSYRTDSGISCFLSFKWMMQERPYFDPPKTTDPVPSPSMAGGLFAVRRDWFFELGGYDEEFKMWGAENVEMAFRYWMCGGRVECTPCSFTYHLYRNGGTGYKSPGEYIAKNRARTAMIWTDKYWQLAREFIDLDEVKDLGNFKKMRELKKRLNCETFDWFLHNVDPHRAGGQWQHYGILGEIRNVAEKSVCLDNLQHKDGGSNIGTYSCHGHRGSQGWYELTNKHQIRNMMYESTCVTKEFKLSHCDMIDFDDRWRSIKAKKWLAFANSKEDLDKNDWSQYKCMGYQDSNLVWKDCIDGDEFIQWNYKYFEWDPNYLGAPEMLDKNSR